jgi:hypothetical protein
MKSIDCPSDDVNLPAGINHLTRRFRPDPVEENGSLSGAFFGLFLALLAVVVGFLMGNGGGMLFVGALASAVVLAPLVIVLGNLLRR